MRRLMALLAIGAFALAACGGGDGEGDGDGVAPCTHLTVGATFTITMVGTSFEPECVVANRSQGLTLENTAGVAHTFTIEGTQVDVEVAGGETANLEPINDAIAAGTYIVYCRFHGTPEGSGMAMELRAQ